MAARDLHTLFTFGKAIGDGATFVDIRNSNTDVCIHIREEDEHEDAGSYLFLDPEEIDLFIATLRLYKYKILNSEKDEEQ